jgi:DNA-binding CsgD family transcriptional regulator
MAKQTTLKNQKRKESDTLERCISRLKNLNDELKAEIELRKRFEADLRSKDSELEKRQQELEEVNTALRVMLKKMGEEKSLTEASITENVRSSIMPYIERLKTTSLSKTQMTFVSMIETHLKKIALSFIKDLSSKFLGLTSAEIEVAILIKDGMSSKEISRLLNISVSTVNTHRYSIRIKTGLKNKKINLRLYLQSLEINS